MTKAKDDNRIKEMIFFSIPTTFDDKLLENVVLLNEKYAYRGVKIKEIYGSLKEGIIGSGRNPWDLPKVSLNNLKEHIRKAHKLGLQFCYLLNAPCLGNIEYTKEGLTQIIEFIKILEEGEVNYVTVANPHLAELIKSHFHKIKLNTSIYCNIDSLHSFNYYQKIGLDRITLNPDIYRNFKLLDKIKDTAKVDLQILVNSSCLFRCPNKQNHANVTGHFSQKLEGNNKEYKPAFWFNEKCMLKRLKDLTEFIKTPWVRPEDISIYHNQFGIKYFKIAGREYLRDRILKITQIYMQGDYEGDLSFLLMGLFDAYEFKRPFHLFIDNKKLDNFLDYFLNQKDYKCDTSCNNCNYCKEYAKKAIRIDERLRKDYITTFEKKLKDRLYEDDKSLSLSRMIDEARIKKSIFFKILDRLYKL